tara:strand:- start:1214 stop:2335 length:1122 start_codon:yes stop_codon:yes gene_type:complete
MQPGQKNNITDVKGIKVGHAHNKELMSGATVILTDSPSVCAVDCRGGAPGTRETDALKPENLIDKVHAIVLSGGSAMGLDAASGVTSSLMNKGIGFHVAKDITVPIVPAAILFDLQNGGKKSISEDHTYFNFGKKALSDADYECPIGNVGAGMGAIAGKLKGGTGSASLIQKSSSSSKKGFTVAALSAVNSFGSVTLPDSPYFWAWPFEKNLEFGGRGTPKKIESRDKDIENLDLNEFDLDYDFESPFEGTKKSLQIKNFQKKVLPKSNFPTNTTLCVIATDASLSQPQSKRIAIMAQDGIARAIRPVHTPFDGDTIFVLSTGEIPLSNNPQIDIATLGMMASDCLSRAIARGVFEAESLGELISYRDFFKNN